MRTILSHEQLDSLHRLADNEKGIIDLDAVEALAQLQATVTRCLSRNYGALRRRNETLTTRLDRQKEQQEKKILAGEFAETGFDSAEVAVALLYQLQQLHTYRLTPYKVNAILYEMYASWLGSKGERLFTEHPVATQFGPRFWHALKRINVQQRIESETWKSFAARNPGIAQFCINSARKYYDVTEKSLNERFMKTDAYRNALPEHNNGKWNKEILDTDIHAWKQSETR